MLALNLANPGEPRYGIDLLLIKEQAKALGFTIASHRVIQQHCVMYFSVWTGVLPIAMYLDNHHVAKIRITRILVAVQFPSSGWSS